MSGTVSHFDVVSPVDGSVYVSRPYATPAEIDAALGAVAAARRGWASTPLAERIAVVERFVDEIVARADDYGEQLAWQMGRPVAYAPAEIRGGLAERARYMMSIAADELADRDTGSDEATRRFIRRRPVGTVLSLVPWNYPYVCAVNSVVPALLAGNGVVLKHAPQTPLVAEHFAESFTAAGLPADVLRVLHADHADVPAMIRDERVDHVVFTGSVAIGHLIHGIAAERFIGVGLELGGKDPAYVRADAELDRTVAALVDGAYFNSGQSCCSIERVYVHRSRYDEFVDAFVSATREYRLGDPLDPATTLGPLVRGSSADDVRGQIAAAVATGAVALIEPGTFADDVAGSPYLAPQVLVGVDHSMAVMRDESFGPVVGIMPVDSDDEAVALMNDSPYGLTASVWTDDLDAALAVAERIETGTCFANRCDYLDPALAWAGAKDSGLGAALSPLGFAALTRPQSFHLRR